MSSVIFSGSYVKALKAGLNLFNNATIWSGNIDPSSSGFTANTGDVYLSTLTALMYIKEGAGNTAWAPVSTVGGSWKVPVANAAALPGSGNNNGDVRAVLDTNIIYEWNGSAWQVIAGPADILSVGTIDSNGASANGASDLNNQLIMQSASATAPGLVNTTTQTFAGNKTFSGTLNNSTLTASELVATDSSKNLVSQATGNLTDAGTDGITVTNGTGAVIGTGTSLSQHVADTTHNGYLSSADWNTFNGKQSALSITNLTDAGTDGITVTNGTGAVIGSSPVTLSQHIADTTHNGYLASTDWNTFNGKQAAGNYITALTGDVTATGPGSAAASVAKIQGTTVSGTTGSTNVVFSTGPTLSNPIVGTQAQLDGSTKAASTSYVDTAVANAVAGVNPAVAVQAATTSASDTSGFTYTHVAGVGDFFTGSVNTAVTIDGFTFTALGQRLLVKNDTQSPSGAFNGIYYVTQLQTGLLAPVLTRALDYDTPADINNTGSIPVVNGTVNGTTSWVQTAQIVTVGTTPLIFVKFTRNPADYLLVANNLSDVASKSTSFNNLSPMTTSGDIIYGGASGTGTRLGANSTATKEYLQSVSSGTPTWQQVAMADLSGTATVTQGGTGISNPTTHNLLIGAGSSALTQLAPVAGTVLAATSASADPSFSATPTLGVTNSTTGQLLLMSGAASGAAITVQNRSATTAYNFNLPSTVGSAGQVLTSQGGGTNNMTWATVSGAPTAPTVQTFTSTGSQTGWLFSVTSWVGTIVAGDTYTNGGHTYTAQQVTQTNGASGFTLFMSGTNATTSSGTDTLTKGVSASGPATISFNGTLNIATATYTTPASVLYLEIKLIGGGGGGSGGNASTSTGNNGTSTYFGPNILNGLFGSGASTATAGAGGTASVGAALGQAVSGATGQGTFVRSGTALGSDGGSGAGSPFAGGGGGGANSGNGANAPANSGAGGGGGGGIANSAYAGAGGGAGGYVNAIITSPAATYPYVVGTGGSGGSTTTNGGNGGSGYIIVVEKYQ